MTTYFDNAATTWPKPSATLQAMAAYTAEIGGSPGRSGHRLSIAAGRIVLETREALAELFHIEDALRIVFAKNATEALNIVLLGLLNPGDHVVTSSVEHNSVMRPLRHLEKQGVTMTIVPCDDQGFLSPQDVRAALNERTRLICLTHASNVTGAVQPIAQIGRIAKEQEVLFCVDAAQSAGVLPIDVAEASIDLLVFSGHKSLFGPQGTGGLYIREGLEDDIKPLMFGGTGSRSEYDVQPDFLPDKYESGTTNTVGIAGLGAGVRFVLTVGSDKIRQREASLTKRFLDGMAGLRRVRIYGPSGDMERTAIVSFTIDGVSPSEAAMVLDEKYAILCRPGLHCAPAAHRTIGTFPQGTIRFSFGYFNNEEEIDRAIEAVTAIAEGA